MNPINKYPKVKSSVQFIDPVKANAYLGLNSERQRKVSKANLDKITSEMKSGRFQLNGESIIVGASGKVLNGQHRLLACVNARVGFWTILVEGIDDELFHSIDVGKSRKLTDILTINGEKNVNVLATTLVRLGEYFSDPQSIGREVPISCSAALDILSANPAVRESVQCTQSNNKLRDVIAPSRIAWLHFVGKVFDPKKTETFFDGLARGTMLADDSPIYALRCRLMAERSTERRLVVRDIMALVIKAWNAHVRDQRLKVIRFSATEPFPIVIPEIATAA